MFELMGTRMVERNIEAGIEVNLMFDSISSSLPQAKSGQLKAIAESTGWCPAAGSTSCPSAWHRDRRTA
jgi:hypothetical protein